MKYNSLNVSGAGREKIAQAQANLEEYHFLQWYTLFIRPKKTKTNVTEPDGPQQFEESTVRLDSEDEDGVESKRGTTLNSSPLELDEGSPESVQKQPNASRSKRSVQNNVLNEISAFLKLKRNKPMSTNTADDLFGKMIAAELKQIPEERKSIVKREITDIIFGHQGSTIARTSQENQPQSTRSFEVGPEYFLQPGNMATPTDVPKTFYNM